MPSDSVLATDQYYRFRHCVERGHYDFVTKADKCDKFFAGDQWEAMDLAALNDVRRPALTINKIISTMSTIMGHQIYNRNEISFRPAGQGGTSEVADALQKVWMQIAANNQLNWLRSDVFADGIIRSRGFYDVRLGFNDSMRGEVTITNLNSKNVVIDPDAEQYDTDEWGDIFITKWLTYDDIALMYSKAEAEYLRDRTNSSLPYGYDSVESVRDSFAGYKQQDAYPRDSDDALARLRRNYRVLERQHRVLTAQKHFVDIKTGDMRPVPESWDRNRIAAVVERVQGQLAIINRQVKRIRWTVTADDAVLHDDWSPYKHFTPVPYFPHFHHGRTIGLVENLLGSQELLNKSSSQELHVINTSANSGWIVKRGTLLNMDIEDLEDVGARTGLVLEVSELDGIDKIKPNATPQGMDRIAYKAEEHMKGISGISDSMQGMDREDVSGKAIATKRQSGQTNLVRVLDNLERSDYFLARNVLDLVQEFYTEERLVHITGNDLVNSPETVAINQYDPATDAITNDLTLGEYGIIITAAPDRATLEDSQFEHAKGLKELGIAIPDDVLIENSRLQRRGEIVKQMQASAQTPEALQRAALEMRALEAEVLKAEGEAKEKHTKSALDEARTQRETAETQALAAGGNGGEQAKLEQELQIERERFEMERQKQEAELDFKRQEFAMKLEFEREKHALDMQIKQQAAAQQAQQAEAQAYQQRVQSAQQPQSSPTTTKE